MRRAVTEIGNAADETPVRDVTFSQVFAAGRHAITVKQFSDFAADTGYTPDGPCYVHEQGQWRARDDRSYLQPGFAQADSHPAVCINWNDAAAFIAWLARKSGKKYRLLTEAEREYVARAGTTTPYWWGNTITSEQANYDGTVAYGRGRRSTYRKATVPVDSFKPNPWGLYQVHGNVAEWVQDCWNPSYKGAPRDGSAWLSGDCDLRALRGGSWGYTPTDIRAAYREGVPMLRRYYHIGFRVGRTLDPADAGAGK